MKLSHVLVVAASATILAGCQTAWWENHPGPQPITFNAMPPAAQATVRNEIGNQPIAKITREYKYGDPSYRVEVDRTGYNPTLWVAADGAIIQESRTLVIENQKAAQKIYEASGSQRPSQTPKQSASHGY